MNWSYILEKNVEKFPNKEAIVFGEQRFTYKELQKRVDALAKAFQKVGIKQGDIVAILLYNCSEYIEITFAVNKLGGVWLPLNYRLAGPELAYIINHSEAKMLISEAEFNPVIQAIRTDIPEVKQFICLGKEVPRGWESYNLLLDTNMGATVAHTFVDLDDPHRLMYTSGTTAYPKGVIITYGNLYWKNIGHILMFDLKPQDKTLVVGPMYHVGGMDLPATGTIYAGGSLVILRKFDPILVLETIQGEKVTNSWFAPASGSAKAPISYVTSSGSLRTVYSGTTTDSAKPPSQAKPTVASLRHILYSPCLQYTQDPQ